MVAIQGVKSQISKALSDPNYPFLFNRQTGELIGNTKVGTKIPKKHCEEGLTALGFESEGKQVKVLQNAYMPGSPFGGFAFWPVRVTDLSTLPAPVRKAISDLLAEGGLTLDRTKEI